MALEHRALLDDRVDRPGHAGEAHAGDVLRQVDDVRADVAERTRAGELLLQAPDQGHGGIDEPVLQVARAHLLHGPDLAGGDEVAGEGGRRNAAVGVAEHRVDALRGGLLGGGGHGLGLGDGVRERLLAEHVLAGLEGGDRDLGVRAARRDDVDDVDVVAGDRVAPVGGGLGPAPLLGGGRECILLAADDEGHLGEGGEVEEPRGDPPALRVGGSHEAVADHRHAHRSHGGGLPLGVVVRGGGGDVVVERRGGMRTPAPEVLGAGVRGRASWRTRTAGTGRRSPWSRPAR